MDSPLNAVVELGALVVLLMLACPVIMGAMMLLMWRGMRHDKTAASANGHEDEPNVPPGDEPGRVRA